MLYLVRSGPVLLGSELPRSLVLRLRDPMTGSSMYWTLRFYWMKNLISSCVILGTRYLPERRQMTSQITLVREGPESQMAGLPGWGCAAWSAARPSWKACFSVVGFEARGGMCKWRWGSEAGWLSVQSQTEAEIFTAAWIGGLRVRSRGDY